MSTKYGRGAALSPADGDSEDTLGRTTDFEVLAAAEETVDDEDPVSDDDVPLPSPPKPSGGAASLMPSAASSAQQAEAEAEPSVREREQQRPARRIGRPTVYTEAIGEELLNRLASPESLTSICRDEHMPSRDTVHSWTIAPPQGVPKDFPDRYTKARERQAETYFDQVLEIADGAHQEAELIAEAVAAGEDVTARAAAYRQTYLAEMAARRLRFDARRWVTARIAPWRYGDQIKHQHQIAGAGRIEVVTGVDAAPGARPETEVRQLDTDDEDAP